MLSASTADYDRGEKLQHYQRSASLAAVVLVDLERASIELWTRSGTEWHQAAFGAGQVVPLDAVRATLSVDEILAAARNA